MPRFVILEHDFPELHWDFMLEVGGSLQTWRLAEPPHQDDNAIASVCLADHRLEYLEYEGPVSGNRGTVRRWDRGDYEVLVSGAGEELRILLHGQRLNGIAVLQTHWTFRRSRPPGGT